MSSRLREMVASFPGARAAWRLMKSLPGELEGLPRIDYSNVSGKTISSCVDRTDPVIVEIGCNDGSNTMWFLDLFENPTIYCFEPDPRAIARFKQKVGERPNVTLFELAISDREGFVDFYQSGGRRDNEWIVKTMPQGWDLSGSIKQPYRHLRVHPLVTFDQKIQVPTVTLDSFCEQHGIGSVDLLWMDVQGAEFEVFGGATRTLASTRLLYTEYSNQELYKGQRGLRDMVKYLRGFSVVRRYPGDVLLRNESPSAQRAYGT